MVNVTARNMSVTVGQDGEGQLVTLWIAQVNQTVVDGENVMAWSLTLHSA